MGALLKPFAWLWTPGQVKPVGIPRIDWSHPLAQGLIFYGFDTGQGVIIDLVRGRPMRSTGNNAPTLASDQWGAGFLYDTSHTNYFNSDAEIQAATAAPPWTFACGLDQLIPSAWLAVPFGRAGNWIFQTDYYSTGTSLNINTGGALTYILDGATPTNSFHTLVGVANSDSSASYFVDGVNQGTATGLSIQSINANDEIFFGGLSTAGILNPCAGTIVHYGAFWGRALSAWEDLQLHLDPYCFLLPPEGDMPALYLPATTIALSALGMSIGAARAGFAGSASLSARASSRSGASARMSGAAALSGLASSRASGKPALSGTVGLAARGSSASKGVAPASGAAALTARGTSRAGSGASASLKTGLPTVSLIADPRFTVQLGLSRPQGPDFSQMAVGETVTGAIDFNKWLPSGVTIASIVSITATNYWPSGGSPYVTLAGAAKIGTAPASVGGSGVGNVAVLQQWTGLACGAASIAAKITTSDGQTLIGWSNQPVRQPPN